MKFRYHTKPISGSGTDSIPDTKGSGASVNNPATETDTSIVHIENISKRYGKVEALKNV